MVKRARRKRKAGGRPELGPGQGRDGTYVRARVTRDQKDQIDRFCAQHGVSEATLVRAALQAALGEKLMGSVQLDPELRHPPAAGDGE
jgi:hypothetical protein